MSTQDSKGKTALDYAKSYQKLFPKDDDYKEKLELLEKAAEKEEAEEK